MTKRRNFTAKQKLAIVRERLLEGVEVSDLCDKHGISPTNFYNWQKQFFENGESAFERKTNSANARRQEDAQARKIEQLEEKLRAKNEVIAELLQEHVELKKGLGEL